MKKYIWHISTVALFFMCWRQVHAQEFWQGRPAYISVQMQSQLPQEAALTDSATQKLKYAAMLTAAQQGKLLGFKVTPSPNGDYTLDLSLKPYNGSDCDSTTICRRLSMTLRYTQLPDVDAFAQIMLSQEQLNELLQNPKGPWPQMQTKLKELLGRLYVPTQKGWASSNTNLMPGNQQPNTQTIYIYGQGKGPAKEMALELTQNTFALYTAYAASNPGYKLVYGKPKGEAAKTDIEIVVETSLEDGVMLRLMYPVKGNELEYFKPQMVQTDFLINYSAIQQNYYAELLASINRFMFRFAQNNM